MYTTRRDFISNAIYGGLSFAAYPVALSNLAYADENSTAVSQAWSTVPFGRISVGGDLAQRAEQNWLRLQHPAYTVPGIFANENIESWPGDWVGRTLLADILLSRSTGRDPDVAGQIVKAMPAYLNKEGYFGAVIDPDLLNEQQLGDSHAWVFRALYQYHRWTGDTRAREMLENLVRKIALPMTQWWDSYPITPDAREKGKGGVNGNGQWRYGRWFLSSDVGNQFMLLDGLTQAWELDRSTVLKASIDGGIERFLKLDLIGLQVQTHATLMTLRALLRTYALTGELRLLQAVRERYDLYSRVAMTENYANYNWFDRPDTWTEPCGSIDSFIVAMQLWQFTGEPRYLEDAHLIWFNGVEHGQRATGGFGCDSCAGVGDTFLSMKALYEATFCCTMRGGEGHSYAIQSAYHTRPGELAATFYTDSQADLDLGAGRVLLRQWTQYPYAGNVCFKVLSSSVGEPVTMRLFAPSWMATPRLRLNGRPLESRIEQGFAVAQFIPRAGDDLSLDSTLKTWVRPTRNPHSLQGYHLFHVGPLLLGHEGENKILLAEDAELTAHSPGCFEVRGKNVMLARINDLNDSSPPSWDPLDPRPAEPDQRAHLQQRILVECPASRRQVLFRSAA